jgi:hypothetical protein
MLPFENIDQKRRKSDFPKQVEPCCLNMHRAECPPYFPTVGGSQLKIILKGKMDLPTKTQILFLFVLTPRNHVSLPFDRLRYD